MAKTNQKKPVKGYVFLFMWAVLILAGVAAKEMYGHPDMVIFFHVPGAGFRVLAWRQLSYKVRERYRKAIAEAEIRQHRSPNLS